MASTPAASRHFSVASSVAVATLLAIVSVGACSGDDKANATDASGDETIKLLCATFSGSGNPCSPVSSQVCFAMCAKGGCKCVSGPSGGGIWKCDTDESCYPGGPDFEGGSDNDSSTAPADASPDSNTTDAASDASTDAQIDAAD